MADNGNKPSEGAGFGRVKPPVSGESANAEPRVRGHTYIADEVVSIIARLAAEQVEGVHQIGSSNLRGIMSRFGGGSNKNKHGGIESEIGLKEAAVDVEIIVEFGYPIRDVTENLRERVIETVESTTGRKVVEVNIWVVDVHVPRVESRPQRRQLE